MQNIQLNTTFFYDGLNDSTKALLDSTVGGILSKVPCNQVKVKIEEVAKNSFWGGAKSSGLPRGMIDTSNLDFIRAKIEVIMDKKLSKFKLVQGSSNVSTSNEAKPFSCRICGGTNLDTSYCGGSSCEHLPAVDYGGDNFEGALVISHGGYGYNPECTAVVGCGAQGQGYAHQGSYNNQTSKPLFNPNASKGNFNQGYNSNNHVPYSNQADGSFPRPNGNRPYL